MDFILYSEMKSTAKEVHRRYFMKMKPTSFSMLSMKLLIICE